MADQQPPVRPLCVPCWIIACDQLATAVSHTAATIVTSGNSPGKAWETKVIHLMDRYFKDMDPLMKEAQGYTEGS